MESSSTHLSQTISNPSSRLNASELFEQMQQLISQQSSVHLANVNLSG